MPTPLRVGHSPDADDAFMFYGIAKGAVSPGPYKIVHVIKDIQALNELARKGDLEVTAISTAMYPKVADKYRILSCGASIGRKYGPVILTKTGSLGKPGSKYKGDPKKVLKGMRIAIPGENTTAYLLIRIFVPGFIPVIMNFDAVLPALEKGKVDAALVIHEGQVIWKDKGYVNLMDLGQAWFDETKLPIPLGLDVVRRDLGAKAVQFIYKMLYDSIMLTRKDEDGALDYSMKYGRGVDRETIRKFVRMYVNEDTEQMGPEGKLALKTLFAKAKERGLLEKVPPLDIVGLK
jgi:1,4-dihydroxy-6-naphthoate synthase